MQDIGRIYYVEEQGYYLPIAYELVSANKVVPITSFIEDPSQLSDEYGFQVLYIAPDSRPDIPPYLSGLCIPVIAKLVDGVLRPLMCDGFTLYPVEVYPKESNQKYLDYLDKVHNRILTGSTCLGDINNLLLYYDSTYAEFYASYERALQLEQQQAQVQQQQAQAQQAQYEQQQAQQAQQEQQQPQQEQQAQYEQQQAQYEQQPQQEQEQQQPQQEQEIQQSQPQQEQPQVQGFAEATTEQVQGFAEATTEQVAVTSEPVTTVETSVTSANVATAHSLESGVNIPNYLGLSTIKSGAYTVVHSASEEEIKAQIEAINALPAIPTAYSDVVEFTPNIYKFEFPVDISDDISVGTFDIYEGLSGLSFPEFKELVTEYITTPEDRIKNIPKLTLLEEEIRVILGKSLSCDRIFKVFNPSYGNNVQLLYELLKYVVVEESPNGLYFNQFRLVYILEQEFLMQGLNPGTAKARALSYFASCVCDIQDVEDNEDEDKSYDKDDVTIAFDRNKEDIRRGNENMKLFLVNILYSGLVKSRLVSPGESVDALKHACVLGKYGVPFTAHGDEYLKKLGYEALQLFIKEYELKLLYFGVELDPTALGATIAAYKEYLRQRDSNENLARMSDEQFESMVSSLLDNGYSNVLANLKADNPYISAKTKAARQPINIGNINLKVVRYIIANYNGKPYPCAVILENLDPKAAITNKYFVCPRICALYKELAEYNIFIEDGYSSVDDLGFVEFISKGDYLRGVYGLPFDPARKDLFAVVKTNKPFLSLQDVCASLTYQNLRGIDPRMVKVPYWLSGDLDEIALGFKVIFS